MTTPRENHLFGQEYKRAYLIKSSVKDGTKKYKDIIKHMGGKFQFFDGEPAWMFPGSYKAQIEAWLDSPVESMDVPVAQPRIISNPIFNMNQSPKIVELESAIKDMLIVIAQLQQRVEQLELKENKVATPTVPKVASLPVPKVPVVQRKVDEDGDVELEPTDEPIEEEPLAKNLAKGRLMKRT